MPHRLAAALVLCFVLRLPALVWPVISDDEAIYDTMAQVVRHGGVMYRDVVDHKPPGLVYSYAAMQQLGAAIGIGRATPARQAAPEDATQARERPGPPAVDTRLRMLPVHLSGALAAAGTAWFLAAITRRYAGAAYAPVAAALYAACTVARCPYDGLAVNGELLMNLPTAAAVWLVLAGNTQRAARRWGCDFAAGALLGVAGLFKWQAWSAGLVLPLVTLTADVGAAAAWRVQLGGWLQHIAARALLWCGGLLLPCALVARYFASQGALDAAWAWGWLFNLHYIGDGPGPGYALMRLGFQLGGLVLPAALLYAGAWRGIRTLQDTRGRRAMVVWAALAAGCVCIGGRFFGHYFLQLELPLCILAAAPVGRWWERLSTVARAGLCLPTLLGVGLALMPQGTRAVFDGGDPDWGAVGERMAAVMAPDDTVFVWGNAPLLYAYANRRPGTRFVFCNYMTGLSPATPSETDPGVKPASSFEASWPMLLADLDQRRPDWVMDTAAAGWKGYEKFPIHRYPALQDYIAAHYEARGNVAGATLLRRRDANKSQTPNASF